jgi:hypothetical protein
VFKNAAESIDCSQRRLEASAIVTQLELVRLARAAMPEPTPALAWRVGDYWVRPVVLARIAGFVPWVNIWQAKVGTASLYI